MARASACRRQRLSWPPAIAVAVLASAGLPSVHAQPLAAAVKATYLHKFAPYVSWPPPTGATGGVLTLCIVGHDPFGPILDQVAQTQQAESRRVVVRRLDAIDRSADCRIAYLGGSRRQSVEDGLRSVRGAPVLTVTDEGRGARARGIVHFALHEGRVRFHIDDALAAQAGLDINSKLLGLALTVRSRGER